MKQIFNRYILAPIGFTGCVFILSSIPMDGGPDNIAFLTNLDPGLQNILHIPLYGILAFLWIQFLHRIHQPLPRAMLFGLVITVLYGGLDEIHQTFVPGRYGGLLDILLNTAGALIGAASYRFRHLLSCNLLR